MPDKPDPQHNALISGDEAEALYASDLPVTIADIRTPDEYAKEHIAPAISLPVNTIEETAPTALPDKNAYIILYSGHGRRSAEAAEKLDTMGYTRLRNLGAITNWTGLTLP